MSNVPLQQQLQNPAPPTLGETPQEIARESFRTVVEPLREGFEKQTTREVEDIARRGVFGNLGAERLGDIIREQQRQEARVASEIGRDIGLTALDQAFRTAEAAKTRSLQRELSERGFEESQRVREFTAEEAEKGREFAGAQAELGREFTSEEAERQREFGLTSQQASQQFAAEQSLLGRTFTREEARLQRDFQQALSESEFSFRAEQADEQRQIAKNQAAINLALSGNIKSDDIQSIIDETFGPGVTLTTQDEVDLQRLATASGLGVDDYMQIRKAIGQGQLRDVLENPQDYVESPQKARDFQLQLTLLANKSAAEIAQIESSGEGFIEQVWTAPGKGIKSVVEGIGSIF